MGHLRPDRCRTSSCCSSPPGQGAPSRARPTTAQLCSQQAFFDHYAAIPRELTTDHPLTSRHRPPGPARTPVYVSGGYRSSPFLSVLFSMFIHEGWLHLLGNMLFLVIFGNNIEDQFRKVPYLVFYLFSGYVAAYGFAFASQLSRPLVGASGAIAGVLGAYLASSPAPRSGRCAVPVLHRSASPRGWCSAGGSCCSGPTPPATPHPAGLRGVPGARLRFPGRLRRRLARAR